MHTPCLWYCSCLLILTLTGCAGIPEQNHAGPSPIVTDRSMGTGSVPQGGFESKESRPAEPLNDPTGVITLRDALSQALIKNPELAGAYWEIRAGEARALQVGVLPNPELGVTVEEFGGNKFRKSFDAAQTTIQLSQLVELGGKRAGRVRLAQLEKDLAGWDYEVKRLDVLTGVAKSFVEVLAAQEQESLSGELVSLAEKVHNSAAERVKAGKISPLEETKSAVALSNARIDWERARNNLKSSRYRLAAMWGQQSPTFEKAAGVLDEVKPVPSIEEVKNLLSRNPDVARYVRELEHRAAAVRAQNAKRIPDITISGGVQRFSEDEETAFIVGVSIPIPIFDQNKGGILEAKHKLSKAKEEYRAAQAKAGSGLGEAIHSLSSAYSEVLSLRNDVLPAAEHSFEASQEGFREGKFDFLELLDAQRTLFSAKIKYIDALAAYHKAGAELERLTGEGLDAARGGQAVSSSPKMRE